MWRHTCHFCLSCCIYFPVLACTRMSRARTFQHEVGPIWLPKLEGNVLRYLRPTKLQMLIRKNFQMCAFVMSKYPWYPNVHDFQMSIMSKCPSCPNVYHVVTLVTCGHTCHMWSHMSHVVTPVTCGHTCHMWSHLSHAVTLIMINQYFNCWPKSEFVVQWDQANI